MVFGMTRTLAVDLPEALDVIEGDRELSNRFIFGIDRLDACQMQYRIEQHRGMPVGQHESIPIGPNWILRVETQKLLPDRVGDRRQCHWRARMPGIRLLHGIHRQRANRVDTELVDGGPVWRLCASVMLFLATTRQRHLL